MKKFIKGTFKLDEDVAEAEFLEKHKRAIEAIIDWSYSFKVEINIGTSDDNSWLLEYKIVGTTASYCKGLLSELRAMLKAEWKKTTSIWQVSGNILW